VSGLLVSLACVALAFGLGSIYLTGTSNLATFVNLALAGVLGVAALLRGLSSGRGVSRGPGRTAWLRGLARVVVALTVTAGLMALAASVDATWDLTERRAYTLTPYTREVLAELPVDVEAMLAVGDSQEIEARLLLEQYAEASDRFRLRVISPRALDRQGQRLQGPSRLILRAGDRTRRVPYLSERHVTQTLLEFVGATGSTLCFLTGHGEPDLEERAGNSLSVYRKTLEREGFRAVPLLLAAEEEVPERCEVVIVVAPERPLLAAEAEALARSYAAGGRLLVFLEPDRPVEPAGLLEAQGIRAPAARLVDRESRPLGSPDEATELLINGFVAHPVTQGLGRQTRVVLSGVRPLAPHGLAARGFAFSSRQSRSLPLQDGGEPPAREGPFAVAASARASVGEGDASREARVVVFGDADFVTNRYLGLLYNEDLALNAVYHLAGRDDEIRIRPKAESFYQVLLTPERTLAAFQSFALLLPQGILMVGIAVWWRRRRL